MERELDKKKAQSLVTVMLLSTLVTSSAMLLIR